METIIEVKDLQKRYALRGKGGGGKQHVDAVRDISFSVFKGEIFFFFFLHFACKT